MSLACLTDIPDIELADDTRISSRQYSVRFANTWSLLLLDEDENQARIACADPGSLGEVLDLLVEAHQGRRLQFYRADPARLMQALSRFHGGDPASLAEASGGSAGAETADYLDRLAEDAPIVNLVNSLFLEAVRNAASDIHLEHHEYGLLVRYRIDGMLRSGPFIPSGQARAVAARLKLLGGLNIMESRLPQDGRLEIKTEDFCIDVRISVIPGSIGESIVLRLFCERQSALGIGELGLGAGLLERLRQLLAQKDGLILATGPTGSGKTTTIHALLRTLDTASNKIVTIEDPVETRLPGAIQVQIRDELGLTFEEMLKRIFRHDPDIIMLGEIRDGVSAELALRAGLTGHLVFSTLHTNDALSGLTRLDNLGMERWLTAAVVRGLLAQRLLRRLCPECRGQTEPSARLRTLAAAYQLPAPDFEPQARGCPHCGGTGYRGRLAVMELVSIDEELAALIGQGQGTQELKAAWIRKGGRPLAHQALDQVLRGTSTLAEVDREVLLQ